MKIFGDQVSGNCMKVKRTADLLQIPYEWVPIDIMQGESRTERFLAMSPAGQVPLVVWEDGRTLARAIASSGNNALPCAR